MNTPFEIVKNSLLGLEEKDLQNLSDICFAIEKQIFGDGAGLTSGFLIDKVICEFFKKTIKDYEEYHVGEADFKLANQPISFKKIRGKKAIALAWSKNPKYKKSGGESIERNFFEFPMVILNLETQKWWKRKRGGTIDDSIDWNLEIVKGFYIINNEEAKNWVVLSENNKSTSVITAEQVYKLLIIAKDNHLDIEIPDTKDTKKWSMLGGIENK